jgi:hypothetical protein
VLSVTVQQHHNLHKGIVGVLSYQKGNRSFGGVFAHDYGAGLGGSQLFLVLAVDQEADVAFLCPPEGTGRSDYHIWVADDLASHISSQFTKGSILHIDTFLSAILYSAAAHSQGLSYHSADFSKKSDYLAQERQNGFYLPA